MKAAFPFLPPAMLGMLGGGQLGRMFVMAAKSMGYRVTVLDPDPHSPAGDLADVHLCAAYDDENALTELAGSCVAVTTEFENVSADSLRWLAQHTFVAPSGDCVAIAQDRIAEKTFFRDIGLPTVSFLVVNTPADLEGDLLPYLPGILKTTRLGYDGKGQTRVQDAEEVKDAFATFQQACVLEKRVDLAAEVSAIVTRTVDGACAVFPVAENEHHQGVLDVSIVPARVSEQCAFAAQQHACEIAARLQFVGVLAVEFFVLADGSLVANEMAPRPHNSGHYTLDATQTSQFQQQVRALCGLPPGGVGLMTPIVMVNVLGDVWLQAGTNDAREPDWRVLLQEPDVHLHLYGKLQVRPGRKMGHFNVLTDSVDTALKKARALQARLRAAV